MCGLGLAPSLPAGLIAKLTSTGRAICVVDEKGCRHGRRLFGRKRWPAVEGGQGPLELDLTFLEAWPMAPRATVKGMQFREACFSSIRCEAALAPCGGW